MYWTKKKEEKLKEKESEIKELRTRIAFLEIENAETTRKLIRAKLSAVYGVQKVGIVRTVSNEVLRTSPRNYRKKLMELCEKNAVDDLLESLRKFVDVSCFNHDSGYAVAVELRISDEYHVKGDRHER